MKRVIAFLAFLTLAASCCSGASAAKKNSEGLYVDNSGQVITEQWDDAAGLYIVNGVGIAIENADNGSSSAYTDSSSGGMTVTSSDGATDPLAGLERNADGSVTVESGQLQIDIEGSTGSGHLTQAEWEARLAKYTRINGVTTGTVYTDESGTVTPVEIVSLGLGRSTILINGKKMVVPTSSLSWDHEVPENKVLAVATPKSPSTYLTLRAKKSKKSFVMGRCDKCKVVRVIRSGKTWSFVDNGEARGYVLTSGLTFYDNKPKTYASAVITIKGKTTSRATVHTRTSGSNKAKQIDEYPVGTAITVFSQDEDWSEIEVDGWHCYMQTKYITLQEPLLTADAAAEAAAEPGS